MPATIETTEPKEIIANVRHEDLPLLVKNGSHVYLATSVKYDEHGAKSDLYSLLYIRKIGEQNTSTGNFGDVYLRNSLNNLTPWNGSVNIENN